MPDWRVVKRICQAQGQRLWVMGAATKPWLPSAAQFWVCVEMVNRLLWIIRLLFGGDPRPWALGMRSMP